VQGKDRAMIKFILEVKSHDHLAEIIKRIMKIKSVISAYKINEKVVLK